MTRSYKELRAIFKKLGAHDPDGWARSETEEGIPQLARFVFLRQAWKNCIIPEGDLTWIEGHRRQAAEEPNGPLAGTGQALERLLARGAEPQDIAELVRGMQYTTLFQVCYLLSDPGELEPDVADVGWVLCETNEDGQSGRPMEGLHENVLGMDPTGREMRPRKR